MPVKLEKFESWLELLVVFAVKVNGGVSVKTDHRARVVERVGPACIAGGALLERDHKRCRRWGARRAAPKA